MLNIYYYLNKMGLTERNRAVQLSFSDSELTQQLFIKYVSIDHILNEGLKAELICLCTNPFIPLKKLIGCQAAIDIRDDQGRLFRMTGITTAAEHGQSDGDLTIYKLTLEDATCLWRHQRNSRVFMNKTVIEVIMIIFKEWQSKSSLFAKSLTLNIKGIKNNYDIRPFIMQHNETTYDFVTRLLRSEGINWLIDETQLFVPNANTDISPQILRLIDDRLEFYRLNRNSIRYHRSDATEKTDTIYSFIAKRVLQPSIVTTQRWLAEPLTQADSGSIPAHHIQSAYYENISLDLDDAWHLSPAWIADLKGKDYATKSGNKQLEKTNLILRQYHNLQAKQFIAYGTVRDAQVGYYFELKEHPEINQHTGFDKEFIILRKRCFHENNLPIDVSKQIKNILQSNLWDVQPFSIDERQACELTLVRRLIPIVPEYNPQIHKPHAYPLHAKVVGGYGETDVYVDEWGRIKVNFLFPQAKDHQHDYGRGSNQNADDSAWVDVLNSWAGKEFGSRFLPRMGEIVVVDFFHGDVDRPYVAGRIHEGNRSPTRFDIKGKLPDTRYLSGIRSSEISSSGFNQLRFDDTKGQISAQLQSSHGASQINLGQLSYPKEVETSKDRGIGFEIRTDNFGAIRGGSGVLLTSYKQANANGDHMHAEEAKTQLDKLYARGKSLNDVAKKHESDQIESIEQLKTFADQIQKDIAKFNSALLLLSSPSGIGLSSAGNIHLSTDENIHQVANGDIGLSTQKSFIGHAVEKISLFAVKLGMRFIAAFGKIEMHAETGAMDIIADQVLRIISKKKKIEITAAEEILLNVKGNFIKITPDNIEQGTKGEFKVYSKQFFKYGPKTINYDLPKDPYNEMYILKNPKGIPVPGFAYKIITGDGQIFRGITNELGETIRLDTGYQTTGLKICADTGEDDEKSDTETEE